MKGAPSELGTTGNGHWKFTSQFHTVYRTITSSLSEVSWLVALLQLEVLASSASPTSSRATLHNAHHRLLIKGGHLSLSTSTKVMIELGWSVLKGAKVTSFAVLMALSLFGGVILWLPGKGTFILCTVSVQTKTSYMSSHQLGGFPRARHFYESKLVTPILAVLSDLGLIGVCHRYTDHVHCALLLNIAAQISVLDLCFSSTNAIPSKSSRMFQILMIVKITPHPFLHEIGQISFLLILQIAFLLWRPWNDFSVVSHQVERKKNDCKAPKIFFRDSKVKCNF